MIALQNVSYDIGEKSILNRVSFTVGEGEKIGLVGRNGAGKSTLFRLILGILNPDSGSILFSRPLPTIGFMPQVVSEIEVPSNQKVIDFLLSGRPTQEIEKQIQVVTDSISGITNEAELTKAVERLGVLQEAFELWGGYNADDELLQIIGGLQLEGIDLDSEVSNLSGGQKSKVSFSRVLYSKPEILLLDEPTNHLDQKSKAWLTAFLLKYRGSVLIISHDASFLDEVVTKVVRIDEISRSSDVFHGNYSQHLEILKRRLEAQGRVAINYNKKVNKIQEFVDRMQGTSVKSKRQAKSREKVLEKLKGEQIEARPQSDKIRVKLSPRRVGSEPALSARDVHFAYVPGHKVITDISFSLSCNERFVIVGRNGAGKSTLLKLIAGLLTPQKGRITIGSKTDIDYYAQEHEPIGQEQTVFDEASSVSMLPQRKLRSVLAQFLFRENTVFQKVVTLSPGERSRLALAKLSLLGGNLLLLDEPTNHLDSSTSSAIAQTLREYGGTTVVVSHDVDFLEALGVERMLMLPQGRIQYYERSIIKRYQTEDDTTKKGGNCDGKKAKRRSS